MKKIANLALAAMAIVASCIFVSCQKDYSEQIAAAQRNADVTEWHVASVPGTYVNGTANFRCLDSFNVKLGEDLYKEKHYCTSSWDLVGDLTSLDGCYDVDTVNGNVNGTSLYFIFKEDKIEDNPIDIGFDEPVSFAQHFNKCHYTPFNICLDWDNNEVRVYGLGEHGDTAIAYGQIIVKKDTVWQHVVDTVFVWQHDTVYQVIYDTIVIGGDTTTYTTYVQRKHKSWDGINAGYAYGTDSVTLTKMDVNHNIIGVSRGTYQHRTQVTYNVPTMTSAVAGNCYNFVNGTANCSGTNTTCTLGATQVVGPVVLDGVDITAYLQGCQPYAQRICFSNLSGDNGTYTIYIVGHDGEDAGTITGPYTISDGRHLVSTDTTWNCGSVTAANYSNGIITYSITRTGTVTRHYSAAPLTETSTISGSTTYTYSVTTSGAYTTSVVGNTANVNSNTASFSGFSVTMTPGAQNFCSHVHTTVTATSTGLTVNGEYNGSTTTVNIPMTPTSVIDLPGTCEAVYIWDSYTGNYDGRTTWIVAMYTLSDGSHVEYQGSLSASSISDFTAVPVTTTGYATFTANKSNPNWGLCKITTAGAPSAAGYGTYSTDNTIGIYEYTINDGVSRVHCNVAGMANVDYDPHHPGHFRDITGGTTVVSVSNVHGVSVNITLQ